MSPFDTYSAPEVILNNSIGGNVGNLIYQYSVIRTLMTEETTITPDNYKNGPEYAEEINANYDCYIIPLADAFRKQFVSQLRNYTKLIKKLKIPVIVIGAGLRAPFEPNLKEGFSFDDDVREFVSAVLEKSSMLGLRGEITSKYLSGLGFKEGVDHTVIGCPSMYAFGRELNIRKTNITKDSMVCVNSSLLSPNNVLDFIDRSMEEFPNHYFIPQWMKELVMTYVGSPSVGKSKKNYPAKMSDAAYMNNRVRYFLNAKTWLDFISKADLAFGARLHGNITATIAGTPSIIFPKDARMRELTEYHGLTHVMANEITKDTRLMDVVDKSDFQSPTKKQGANFDHFIDFLDKNNLEHIYKENPNPSNVPFDDAISKVEHQQPLCPVSGCSLEEMVDRWEKYYPVKNTKDQMKIENKNKQIKTLQSKLKKSTGTLNRKSVRLALKTANLFSKY